MEKKQTAVELLIEQIKSKADSLPYNTKENRIAKGIYVDCLMMAKQAKEMEKQQIIDAYNQEICLHLDKEFVSGVFGGYWCPKCNKNVDSELEQD
jgi:hypothetical protein